MLSITEQVKRLFDGSVATITAILMQRKNWAIALIGSIASFLTWFIIGLIPLILVILSKNEFGAGANESSQVIPLELAKERYAKGEISKEEYEQIKKDLT
jgi:putative membrane protein